MHNSLKLNRDQAMTRVQGNAALLEVYGVEKQNIDAIIDQALNYPSGANRWPAYEALKRQAKLLVGWDAPLSSISTSQHYEQLAEFIDYLLPQPINEDETPRSTLYLDEETVSAWYAKAELVLEGIQARQALLPAPQGEGFVRLGAIMHSAVDSEDDDAEVY